MSRDGYVKIAGTLGNVYDRSVWFMPDGWPENINIPRSLIYGPDELGLSENLTGEHVELRIMTWKASQLGLA